MSRLGRPAAVLAVLLLAGPAAADPLRRVPDSAQLVVTVENPRKLAEALTTLDAVKQAQALAPVRTVLDSTTARRFFQMLGYVEGELGAKWPDLLDQIAGGGIAIGTHFGNEAPAIIVLEGTDKAQSAKAFDLFIRVIEEELTRQGSKEKAVRGEGTVRIGDGLHAARLGTAILVSNKAEFLQKALALPRDASIRAKATYQAAARLLPKGPLAGLWIDFDSVKEQQATKDFFAATRKDFLQTLVAGGTIDCLRRSAFVAAGLYREKNGLRFAVRLPAGRSEFPPEFALHVPPGNELGSLPLLEPPGVVYSQSFYLDIGYYWKHRDKLINEEMRKQLEQAERDVSKILPGTGRVGELLEMWGPHHRLVVVNHDKLPYATVPSQRLPAFGYVGGMHDRKFAQGVEPALRAAGLVANIQLGLRLAETEFEGVKILAYRFPEGKLLADDPDGLRFNFEPCYAVVGDEYIVATTLELCKKLITEVRRTAKLKPSPVVWRGKGNAIGAATALAGVPDPLVTDAILGQGVGLAEARQQVADITAWLRFGSLRIEIDEAAAEYRFDLVWDFTK